LSQTASLSEYEEKIFYGIDPEGLEFLNFLRDNNKLERVEWLPGPNAVKIKASHHVGIICLPNLSIFIRPKIDTKNVLYMVGRTEGFYDQLSFYKSFVSLEPSYNLLEFVVQLFLLMADDLLAKGLWKSYVRKEEALPVVRGRIMVSATLIKTKGFNNLVYCDYEDYTHDIIENQVIKFTLARVARTGNFSPQLVRKLSAALSDTTLLPWLDSSLLDRITYHRLNESYRPVHGICKLILRNLAIRETVGGTKSYSFLVDMEELFERFIKDALERRLTDPFTKVSYQEEQIIPKIAGPPFAGNVHIKPDIVVKRGERTVLVDTKWKAPLAKAEEGYWTVHHDNFYQMATYITKYKAPGILVYPADKETGTFTAEYKLGDEQFARLRIQTIDMGLPPDQLESEITLFSNSIQELLS
jgi:5-methylcytosine-specific restriction enzyme subunit McrC